MYQGKHFKLGMAGAAIAASMLLWAPIAGADTADGTVGATSTGTVDLSILVPNLVMITGLDAIELEYEAGNDVVGVENFCVWATAGTEYTIQITSANGSGVFEAIGAATSSSIDYTVDFDDDTSVEAWQPVTEGVVLGGSGYTTASNGARPGCVGGDNAAIRITAVEADNLDGAAADDYQDELTLLVTAI
ncbi:MAG: hypothetical protein ACNA7W_13555 [Pseudomonadales bacterium]